MHHRQTFGGIPVSHPVNLTVGVDGRTDDSASIVRAPTNLTFALRVPAHLTTAVHAPAHLTSSVHVLAGLTIAVQASHAVPTTGCR